MSDESKDESKEDSSLNNLKDLGTPDVNLIDKRIQVLQVIGQIEGHMVLPQQTKSTKYEHVIPQLISFEIDEDVKGILVILNTIGGDVEAGLAIAEMIHSLSKPTVSLVIGGSHSIGVPIATAADFSFISPTATMIVHPIRLNGMILGVSQTFEYFNKMQERIIEFITRTSSIKKDDLESLMHKTDNLLNDMGSILIGKQAVDCGLINKVGGVSDAIKKLNEMIEKGNKMP